MAFYPTNLMCSCWGPYLTPYNRTLNTDYSTSGYSAEEAMHACMRFLMTLDQDRPDLCPTPAPSAYSTLALASIETGPQYAVWPLLRDIHLVRSSGLTE